MTLKSGSCLIFHQTLRIKGRPTKHLKNESLVTDEHSEQLWEPSVDLCMLSSSPSTSLSCSTYSFPGKLGVPTRGVSGSEVSSDIRSDCCDSVSDNISTKPSECHKYFHSARRLRFACCESLCGCISLPFSASLSACSLPSIFTCEGTHTNWSVSQCIVTNE